jgi:2-(1,2-epoxy-1,2-dihydrophenyl)acetyl-CoA isomerase
MHDQPALLEIDAGIATITLNRPDKLNAYTVEMGDCVVDHFRRAQADDSVRAIVLTGAGRAFCAGVDLEAFKALQQGDPSSSARHKLGEEPFLTELPLEIWRSPKPVIAALNGHAIGVGITMALPCDLRVAAENAKLGLTFAKLGILPGLGSTHLLPPLVGRAKALELVLTAEPISGSEAAAIGLVNCAVPADQVLAKARALAMQMAQVKPEVLAAAKQVLGEGPDLTLADAMANERKRSAELRTRRG